MYNIPYKDLGIANIPVYNNSCSVKLSGFSDFMS